MVQRLKISQFYGAPTALRLLLKYDDSWVQRYDRSSLRMLGSGQTGHHGYQILCEHILKQEEAAAVSEGAAAQRTWSYDIYYFQQP